MHIQAPDLPRGFSRDASLIKWREDVLVNGTQLDPADLRTVSVLADGIQVDARLVAPERLHADPYLAAARAQSPFIAASIQDPAKGKSVFQARYRVGWKKRLSVQDLQQHVIESLQLTPQQAGTTSTFSFLLVNQGPDDLIVEQAYIYDDSSSSFKIDTIINRSIRAWSSLEVVGSFSAPPSLPGMFVTRPPYTVTARVRIKTNDPVEPYCEFFITGRATSPPLTADDVKVAPSELAFGLVPVGEWRWGDAWIWNFSSKDITLRQHALINPVTGVELDESASPLVLVPIPHSGMHVKASSYANIRVLFKPTAPEPVRATWRVRFETDTYLDPNKPPEIIQTFISASGWGGLSRLPNIPRPSELKLPAAVRRILERQLFGRRR